MCTCERLEHTHTSRSTKTQTPVDRLCCRGGRARVQLHCEIHTVCNHTQLRPQIDCGAVPAAPECNCTADFMQRPPFQCFAGDADHARRRVAHQVRAIHSCMMTLCFPRPAALPLGWVICKLTHARTHLSKLSNAAVDSPVPRLCRFHVPPGLPRARALPCLSPRRRRRGRLPAAGVWDLGRPRQARARGGGRGGAS